MDAIERTLDQSIDEAEQAIRSALAGEGFGILTEIDVAATLKAKLGVERPALKILGACNPSLAHQALGIDPGLALLLPCNVVLEAAGDGRTRVSIADPRVLLASGDAAPADEGAGGSLAALAAQAAASLERALRSLEG